MINFFKTSLTAILLTIAVITVSSSCKKSFDAPPGEAAPVNLTANYTIAQLKARHTVSGSIDLISNATDLLIRGIVIADDKSGNFYKTIVIQDATGGISVSIDGTNLYNSFPIGREVFIKLNGLYISDYNSMPQLGAGIQTGSALTLTDISSANLSKYVTKGTLNNVVVPADVTAAALTTSMQDRYQNTLIRLSNMEFASVDTSKTYASAGVSSPSAASFKLYSCASTTSSIELRTSNYANFAAMPLGKRNGTITGIFSLYRTTKQFAIRDTTDVKFYDPRCGSVLPPPPPPIGTILLSENFESQTVPTAAPYNPVSITGWNNLIETGTAKIEARSFGTPVNKYAQIIAFGSGNALSRTWLATKAINLATYTTKTLTFDTKAGFHNGATLKVLVSTDYTGTGNPWASTVTWTDITATATLSPGLATGYPANYTSSGNVSLNGYTGTIYIAFRYDGTDPAGNASDKTSTWQLDNIIVTGN